MKKISILFLFFLLSFLILLNCKKDTTKPDPTPSFELIEIKQTLATVHLGEQVTFTSITYNPEDDTLRYFWSASN